MDMAEYTSAFFAFGATLFVLTQLIYIPFFIIEESVGVKIPISCSIRIALFAYLGGNLIFNTFF